MEISAWTRLLIVLCILAVTIGVHPQAVQAATRIRPGWVVVCNYSHSLKDDPIVFPGQPGASHLHDHDFVGAKSTDAYSTFDSLGAGGTACAMPSDTSAYWIPALYEDGQRLLPAGRQKNALVYYRKVAAPAGTVVQPFPLGLKIVMGNGHAMSPQENPGLGTTIVFGCGNGPALGAPPTDCAAGILVVSFYFPNCWDGKNLDSPDHMSHMAYPLQNRCPTSHPVNLPRVEPSFRYRIGVGHVGTITFSSGPYYTAHTDFINAWDPSALQSLVTKCINAGIDCGQNPSPGG